MGGLFVIFGLLTGIAGIASVIYPLKFLRIQTRAQGALVLLAGVVLFIVGGALLPTPEPAQKQTTGTQAPSQSDTQTKTETNAQASTDMTSQANRQTTKQDAAPAQDLELSEYNFTVTTQDGEEYKGKIASDVGVAVIDVREAQEVGKGSLKKTTHGKFVLVHIAIENGQKDAIAVSSARFKILYNGKEYSTDDTVTLAMRSENRDVKPIVLENLNPDVLTDGWLAFEVPRDMDVTKAQLKFSGGFFGRSEVLPLLPVIEDHD